MPIKYNFGYCGLHSLILLFPSQKSFLQFSISQPLPNITKTQAFTMSSSFANSFDHFGGDSPAATGAHSFDDGYPNFGSTIADSHPPIYVSGGEFTSDPARFSSETNDSGPILPPPAEMEHEECYALREWRRSHFYF